MGDGRCDGGKDALEESQGIQPLVGGTLEAAVVEVVPIDIDARAQRFLPRKRKNRLAPAFPPALQVVEPHSHRGLVVVRSVLR